MLWYRSFKPVESLARIPHAERAYPNRIDPEVCAQLLDRLNSKDYEDLSVTQAWYRLLDNGESYASMSSTHRIVKRAGGSEW